MANQDYFWFDVQADSVGKVGMRYLTQNDIKLTLGHFIVNPYNRTILSKVPNHIRDIEQNTHDDFVGDERQAWSNAKMKQFQTFIRNAFESLMEEDIQSLVNLYAKNWNGLEDFIAKRYNKGEVTNEGLSPEWKLKHVMDKNSRRDLIGYQYSIGRSDKSSAQKKLSDDTRRYTSEEFFGLNPKNDSVVGFVDVEFKAPTSSKKVYGDIIVKFKIDHTNGVVSKKIFKDAGFSKFVLKDNPADYGGSIREGNYSQGWNHETLDRQLGQYDSKETAGLFGVSDSSKWTYIDSDSVWSGQDDKIGDKKRELREREIGRTLSPVKQKIQDDINSILYATRGGKQKARNRINRDKRIPENQKRQMIKDINERSYNGKILTQKEADELIAPLKEKLENTQFREERKVQGAKRDKEAKQALNDNYTLELRSNDDIEKLKEIFIRAYDPKSAAEMGPMQATSFEDEEGVRDLIEDWMESGELYDDYLVKVMDSNIRNPWKLMEYSITLTLKEELISGNKIMIPSKGIVKGTKMVSQEALLKPAQMESQKRRGESSYIQLPKRTKGQTKYAASVKDTQKDEGVNDARLFLVKRMKGNIEDIIEAAQEIGLNLTIPEA